jgi:hypothetical protein
MKRVLLVIALLTISFPAFAQLGGAISSLLGGSPTTTRNNITVMNMPQDKCSLPQNLIGKSIYQIEGMRFSQPVRIIHPGEMISSDYNERRINIMLDTQGIIRNVHCG